MASELTKNEFWVKKMTVRFHAMDLNKDGVLTKADFDIFTERNTKIGKLNDAQAERNWKLHAEIMSDFGIGSELTLAEFIEALVTYATGIMSKLQLVSSASCIYMLMSLHDIHVGDHPSIVANKLFDTIDTDGDGVISYSEWAVYFEIIGIDVKHARSCFDALDANKDGEISRSEFVDANVNFFRSTDENHPSRFAYGPI